MSQRAWRGDETGRLADLWTTGALRKRTLGLSTPGGELGCFFVQRFEAYCS